MELLSSAQSIEKKDRLLMLDLTGNLFYPGLQVQHGMENLNICLTRMFWFYSVVLHKAPNLQDCRSHLHQLFALLVVTTQ